MLCEKYRFHVKFLHLYSVAARGLIWGGGAGRIRTRVGRVRCFKIVLPCPDELTDPQN